MALVSEIYLFFQCVGETDTKMEAPAADAPAIFVG